MTSDENSRERRSMNRVMRPTILPMDPGDRLGQGPECAKLTLPATDRGLETTGQSKKSNEPRKGRVGEKQRYLIKNAAGDPMKKTARHDSFSWLRKKEFWPQINPDQRKYRLRTVNANFLPITREGDSDVGGWPVVWRSGPATPRSDPHLPSRGSGYGRGRE